MTIQEKAQKMLDQFERRERDDKSKFWCLKDDAENKEIYQDIIFEAHDDMMPDDYKYRFVDIDFTMILTIQMLMIIKLL